MITRQPMKIRQVSKGIPQLSYETSSDVKQPTLEAIGESYDLDITDYTTSNRVLIKGTIEQVLYSKQPYDKQGKNTKANLESPHGSSASSDSNIASSDCNSPSSNSNVASSDCNNPSPHSNITSSDCNSPSPNSNIASSDSSEDQSELAEKAHDYYAISLKFLETLSRIRQSRKAKKSAKKVIKNKN